jgi:phosphate transport system ATP-binding protein
MTKGDDEDMAMTAVTPIDRNEDVVEVPEPAPLTAELVNAWFGDHHVLSDISLEMPAGSITALIGPSGCGKSTFLRILNRMHELVPGATLAGKVRLDGVDVYGREVRATETRRRIGMVFQKPNPFPAMTISENVLSGLKLAGMKTDDPDELVESCLRKAGLWNEVKNRLGQAGGALSGGQQQRLCIARSLAVEPEVLLMDEPFAALDAISKRIMQKELLRIWQQFRMTIVYITHDVGEAVLLGQKVAMMRRGPASSIKEEFTIECPYPRKPTDEVVTAIYARVEASLQDEVGVSLYAA